MAGIRVASLIGVDFNLSAEEVEELLVDEIPGARLARGRGPDHAIVAGAKILAVRRLEKFGSDHYAILVVLDVDGIEVRALLWNVWVGQKPTAVRETLERLIREHHLDVILLNEAYRCRRELRQHLDDWAVHQGQNIGEGADCAVLVHHRHRITHRGVMRMRRTWKVLSKNRTKTGREYPFARVRLNAGRLARKDARQAVLRALAIHFPTDHPVNTAAVDESIRRTIRWAKPRQKENQQP